MSTAGYLQDAKSQQSRLATILTNKGITASATEKYDSLVDKVEQIEELKGEEITLENFVSTTEQPYKDITPSVGKNAITKIRQPGVTSSIDSNIVPENIKKDVSILGTTGDYICNYSYDDTTKELVLLL